MLERIRPSGSETDHLFIGTERSQYFTLCWNSKTRQVDTIQSFVDVSEKHMRDSQSLDRSLIDPKGQYLALELFQGVLNLIKIVKPRKGKTDYLEKPEQIRISELWVRSSTFLYTESKIPKLALLYQDDKTKVKLATYRLTDEKGNYRQFDSNKDREDDIGDLDLGASHLIPVPKGEEEGRRYAVRHSASAKAHLGGVIVVGETKMLYLDDESKITVQYALDEASIFVAWAPIDGLRYLLADDFGKLHLLTIHVDGPIVLGMDVKQLGLTSKASKLIWLGDNLVFVASHTGDCHVIQLSQDYTSFQVLQTMPNIAPILDFTIMDLGSRSGDVQTNEYSSGQARIVTGSGAFREGSLRSVRSGVGLEDIGILPDMVDVRDLFPLRQLNNTEFINALVVSFVTETRVFTFQYDGEIEEVEEYGGFSLDENTLLAANLPNDKLVQVTESGVRLTDAKSGSLLSSWNPPSGYSITSASGNDSSLLIAVGGRLLISLDPIDSLKELARQDLGENEQVACIHVPPAITGICLVGFWKSGSLSLLSIKSLELIHGESLAGSDEASVPRDIALTQILPEAISGPTLFVAMADGNVLTFSVNKTDYSLSGKKSVILGTQQAKFQILPREDGLSNVFATCEHPSLIYGSEGRIVYSAVTAEDAICVCPFNAEAYPESIVVATPITLKISQIDSERRTHVQTLPMGESIRRIAYSASEKVFGLGGVKRELIQGEEIISSNFRLVDEIMFGDLGNPFSLHNDENNGTELVESIIRAELTIPYGKDGEEALPDRFIVGTSYLSDISNAGTQTRGRILVFGVDSDRNPYLLAEQKLKGGCRRLAVLDGKIVAALVKTVVMYKYDEDVRSGSFTKIASYRTATCPIDLVVQGNTIAVGDMKKSMSLVEYTAGKNGRPAELTEVARHHQSSFTTAIAHIEGDSYVTADADGNLMILRRNREGVTDSDKRRMEITSEINIGEQVNAIKKVMVEPTPGAVVHPRALMATVSFYLPKHMLDLH